MARMKQGVFSWEDVLAQRYQTNKPPPLPRSRRRTLTTAQPQLQCGLLSRLSPELRLIIWELVLGDNRFHIIQRTGQRLGHIVCPVGTTSSAKQTKPLHKTRSFCEICHGGGIPQPIKEDPNTKSNLLSLALTSRQTYHESIHLLYSLNTFEFSNPWSLPYLRPTIPTDLWECIRTVELRWSFPGHWLPSKDPVRTIYVSAGRAQWQETCRALAKLPSLQGFVLVLGSTWYSEPVEKLPLFLEPLRGLKVQGRKRLSMKSQILDSRRGMRLFSDAESGSGLSSDEEGVEEGRSCCFESKVDPGAAWELRLQGQPYYGYEVGRVGEDLRRRGVDCCISMM